MEVSLLTNKGMESPAEYELAIPDKKVFFPRTETAKVAKNNAIVETMAFMVLS